jgi:hypothetical protein
MCFAGFAALICSPGRRVVAGFSEGLGDEELSRMRERLATLESFTAVAQT